MVVLTLDVASRQTVPCLATVDEKDAHTGQSQKCLARPLLNQLRRNHGQGGEGLALAVHVDGTEGDERFASPALCDHRCTAGFVPAFHHAHDRECLCQEWLTQELCDQRRRWIVKAVQGWECLNNPFTQPRGPRTEIRTD
ncbi:MAG: hypothetical protein DMG40_25365 [Acidobacteria bacterium]|nr:MAG: hypothetical protein DMG40_25365 [Acidobacteriota bacterium]